MTPVKLPADGDVWGWMTLPLRRYAQFQGRSCRREFWFYSLFLTIGHFVCFALVIAATFGGAATGDFGWIFMLLAWIFWGAFFFGNFIPGLAVSARRFHDLDLSGAMLIVVYFGMMILSIFAWIAYLVVMALPPHPHPNRYGPPVGEDLTANIFR